MFPPIFNRDQVPELRSSGIPAAPPGPVQANAQSADVRGLFDSPPGSVSFDRIDRISYVAPPTSGQVFPIFTVSQDITRGFITRLGIASPQIDFFGQNEYQFVLDGTPPYDQAMATSGNILSANTFFGFIPIGTLEAQKVVRIEMHASQVFGIKIRPQTTPAASVVVYNLFIRSTGYFWQ
jgi:hypothetical protein